jgi:mono/diheme cytochrome c family protein
MNPMTNTALGLAFLVVGMAATFLMYYLWGFPFDHDKLKSSAPPRLMLLHRALGYLYVAIYVVLMTQMVPRLWRYQVEFPARTVAHFTLGISIGALLLVKIVIVRFFKHLEGTLVPFLGTLLLICTILLLGLSVPFALRAWYLRQSAAGGSAFSPENLSRVSMLLPRANLPPEAPLESLATPEGLRRGQAVLLNRCTQCHDLRTVLAKPRQPDDWFATVGRMGERSNVLQAITREDQWYATAYLIAITPELQQGVERKRRQDQSQARAAQAVATAAVATTGPSGATQPRSFDLAQAKSVFQATCVQCHALSKVENNPPGNDKEVKELVERMVGNGLKAPENDLAQVIFYLTASYAK